MESRKFRELIPLCALALMIVGAIALLISFNGSSDTKVNNNLKPNTEDTNTVLDNKEEKEKEKEEETKVEEEKEEDEVSKPVMVPEFTLDLGSDKTDDEKSDESKEESKPNSNKNSYISGMVDKYIPETDGSVKSEPKEDLKIEITPDFKLEETKQDKEEVVKEETKPVVTPVVKPVVTPVVKPAAPTYKVIKSVYYNGYTISETNKNNLILVKSSNPTKILSFADVASINNMQMMGNYLVVLENRCKVKRFYVGNGRLDLKFTAQLAFLPKTLNFSNDYLYALKNDGVLYAYKMGSNGITQAGFMRNMVPIDSFRLTGNNIVEITDANGKVERYTFNGLHFKK